MKEAEGRKLFSVIGNLLRATAFVRRASGRKMNCERSRATRKGQVVNRCPYYAKGFHTTLLNSTQQERKDMGFHLNPDTTFTYNFSKLYCKIQDS
jgi:hypothetical protein